MPRKNLIFKTGFLLLILCLTASKAEAQTTDVLSTFNPYSLFGIGDISGQGSAFNKGMGGIGIGVRDVRYLNYLNPAAVSERDSLSFMLNFGLEQKNTFLETTGTKSAYNGFNVHHFVISLPLYKRSAIYVGVTPFSDVGYKIQRAETNPAVIDQMGDVRYQKYGHGGVTKIFAGASLPVFRGLSLGAEGIYYFGTIDRFSNILFTTNSEYRQINTGTDYVLGAFSAKAGLQYNVKVSEQLSATLGATYTLKSNLSGDITRFATAVNATGTLDTASFNVRSANIEIPSEIGAGISLRKKDKWMIGADYIRQDWSSVNFGTTTGVNFTPAVSHMLKAGFEYIPNIFDVRYYMKRVTYRGGAYYEKSYLSLDGKQVNNIGVTMGVNLPIFMWYNSLGVAVNLGQRGSFESGSVRERYVMFVINFNLHDNTWFRKVKYD